MSEQNNIGNNKRIAKNTILLYMRMILLMIVSLYTSRAILETLGVEDYGIYNVVGGVVSMASILTGTLAATCSRFVTYSLGKDDICQQRKVFSTSVIILLIFAIIVFVLAEILGVWFLNNQMNIPTNRMYAANFVLQCSIFTFILNLISVPYSSVIIAHEQMRIYAYISILEVLLKLLVVFALFISPIDRLISYSILLLSVAILIRGIYANYCGKKFEESKFSFIIDKTLIREMFGFAGWSFIGCSAQILLTQGVNILTNIFFNVTLNAARGVATQVDVAVRQVVNNFMTAIKPQITKSYANGNYDYTSKLVYYGAKYSYFLVLFFAIPFLFEAEFILSVWLKEVPNQAALFTRWTILILLSDVLSDTLITANAASGKIKKYQLVVGGFNFLIFPISYICFTLQMSAVSAYIVHFTIFTFNLFVRIYLMREIIPITYNGYFKNVIVKILGVSIGAILFPAILLYVENDGIIRFFFIVLITIFLLPIIIYYIGLNTIERGVFVSYINNIVNKLKNNAKSAK